MTPEVRDRIEQIRYGNVPEGYKKTSAGIIPLDWQCYAICECVQIKNNDRRPISEEVRKTMPGPYPYYGPTQAQGYIDSYMSEGPAVLIGEDGDHFLKYKTKPMTLYVDGQYTVNNHAHMIVGTELCIIKWFYYAYQYKSLLNAITRQGAGRYKLTKKALEKLPLQMPCLNEQKKVVDIISTQDKVIELKEKRLAEKQRQKKYLMQQLLTGKRRLAGFSGEWKQEKLSNFCSFIGGGTPDTKNVDFWKGDVPWISSSDLVIENYWDINISRFITKEAIETSATKRCPVGCILLVSRVGVGKIAIAPQELCTSQDFTNIVQTKHDSTFLMYSLFWLMQYKSNQVQGSAIKGIPAKEIKEYALCFPVLEEQKAIVNVLSTADREIDLLRQDIEQEKQKKKALMQLLLTGIARV